MLSKSEPEKAADMVLRLSQLLRYQLYDGARDKVLLNSEITFLNNYLALEKFYSDSFDYRIVSETELTGVLIPPLLLVAIIQYALKEPGSKQVVHLYSCRQAGKGNRFLLSAGSTKPIHRLSKSWMASKHVSTFFIRAIIHYPLHRTKIREQALFY